MKFRNDYVSNSSSCSFIIKVNTEDEIEKLKEYFKKNKDICNSGYISLNVAATDYWDSTDAINPNTVLPGECLYVNVGEDHFFETIDKFNRVSNEISEMGCELYQDPEAHYSIGKKLPKIEDNW